MTNDTKAPERKWMYWDGRNLGLSLGNTRANIEYIRHDLHLSLVAAERNRCADCVVAADSFELASEGITKILSRIYDEETDAQAALEAHDKWIREETLMGAAAYV